MQPLMERGLKKSVLPVLLLSFLTACDSDETTEPSPADVQFAVKRALHNPNRIWVDHSHSSIDDGHSLHGIDLTIENADTGEVVFSSSVDDHGDKHDHYDALPGNYRITMAVHTTPDTADALSVAEYKSDVQRNGTVIPITTAYRQTYITIDTFGFSTRTSCIDVCNAFDTSVFNIHNTPQGYDAIHDGDDATSKTGLVSCQLSSGSNECFELKLDKLLEDVQDAAGGGDEFVNKDSPIWILAHGGAGGNGHTGSYAHGGKGGAGGIAMMVTSYSDLETEYGMKYDTLYYFLGSAGGNSHYGGTGGASSTIATNHTLYEQNLENVLLIAGGGGGGNAGDAHTGGDGYPGGVAFSDFQGTVVAEGGGYENSQYSIAWTGGASEKNCGVAEFCDGGHGRCGFIEPCAGVGNDYSFSPGYDGFGGRSGNAGADSNETRPGEEWVNTYAHPGLWEDYSGAGGDVMSIPHSDARNEGSGGGGYGGGATGAIKEVFNVGGGGGGSYAARSTVINSHHVLLEQYNSAYLDSHGDDGELWIFFVYSKY